MAKYFVCEGSGDAGVTKVTEVHTPEEALKIAQESKESVHFISTVNPFTGEGSESKTTTQNSDYQGGE